MKVIVVGGTGTIGSAVVARLKDKHEVVIVGHESGDIHVDINDLASINKMYQHLGAFDALVSTIGKIHFAPLTEMQPNDYQTGLQDKLMGQVNLVLLGIPHINDQGSFTLTSGILSHDPIRTGTSASMVNAAIDGFVRGCAIELPRGIRINAVSPTVITESLSVYGDYFPGFTSISADDCAQVFIKSIAGWQTGQVYKAGYC